MAYQENDAYGKLWVTKLTDNDITPKETLGSLRELADGRKFRYLQMTGTNCALGEVLMPATKVAVANATSADGVGPDGATTTIITDSGAGWTVDAYVGWYFKVVTSMTGSNEPLKIVGNSEDTLTLEKSIVDDLTGAGTDDGEILAGNSAGILATSGGTNPLPCVGVCIGVLTQDYYGWVQVRGPAAVLSDLITEGVTVSLGGTVAGKALATGGHDDDTIGICVAASGDDECGFVDLRIV